MKAIATPVGRPKHRPRRGKVSGTIVWAGAAAVLLAGGAYYGLVYHPAQSRAEEAAIEGLRRRNMLVLVMPGRDHAQTANLMGEPVDDAMMTLVGDLRYLEQLILNDTGLRDEHLLPLGRLTRLNSLSLGRNALTGQGLRHLAGLAGLETLALRGNPQLGDQGLEVIGRLRRLRVLDLALCNVTDAGVAQLTGLNQLQHLVLADNPVTDEAIQSLSRLPALTRINLGGTRVSPAGIRALSEARAGITIELQSLAEPQGEKTSPPGGDTSTLAEQEGTTP